MQFDLAILNLIYAPGRWIWKSLVGSGYNRVGFIQGDPTDLHPWDNLIKSAL